MKLIDDLIAYASPNNTRVLDVRVGVSWTGVWSKHCGLAKTYGIPVAHGNYTRDMGHLTEKTALELAEYSYSWNLVEASIGVAAINSITKAKRSVNINAPDLILYKARGKKVAVSGSFPFNPNCINLPEKCGFSNSTSPSSIPPTVSLPKQPPSILFRLRSGYHHRSTLINKSAERLLELAQIARAYTVVLGPSTPLSEVWFDYGVDLVAGAEVIQPEAVLLKLSQSGGMLDTRVCPGEIVFKAMQR